MATATIVRFKTVGAGPLINATSDGSIRPTKLTKSMETDKNKFGGKACSLISLMKEGFLVPPAWVYPCELSVTRPEKLSFGNVVVGGDNLVAVRSGAPISMPGLMATKLGVNCTDKEAMEVAVREVWDSYHSEQAKAYRKAKGYDEKMGTAVTIQKMVENQAFALTAFTADPNRPDLAWEFNPVIEYVEGLGDKLVGGEDSKTVEPDSQLYKAVIGELERIHETFGASDVELCVDTFWTVWFVQQRPLKFAELADAQDVVGDTIAIGRPIGAPVIVVGRLTNDASAVKQNVLYMKDFKPELYNAMVEAAAIVTANGGTTCHASILGRDMGKPAVSGLKNDFFEENKGKIITVDGRTGKIVESTEEDLKKFQEAGTLIEFVPVLDEKRVPRLGYTKLVDNAYSYTDGAIDLNLLLVRFYNALDQCAKKEITVERQDEIVAEIADILRTYAFVITACEARHLRDYTQPGKVLKYRDELAELGLNLQANYSNGRAGFVTVAIPQPKNLQHTIDMESLLVKIFNEGKWSPSFGGAKWGKIAQLALDHFEGRKSDKLFVDAAFNMRHNGGLAFDKFTWMRCDNSLLEKQLDTKAKYTVKKLIEVTKSSYSTEQIKDVCTREKFVTKPIPDIAVKANKPKNKIDPSPADVAEGKTDKVAKPAKPKAVTVKKVKEDSKVTSSESNRSKGGDFVVVTVTPGATKAARKKTAVTA